MVGRVPHAERVEERKGALAPLTGALSHRLEREHEAPLFQRDPEFIRRHLKLSARYTSFFAPEVRGLENLPPKGPVLVVGNHSCPIYMPDVWIVGLAIVHRRGLEQPSYGLTYDLLVGAPGIGPFLRRAGAIPAGGQEAELALEEGALLLVYPGGDLEACRPWTQRDQVNLEGHKGFVRLALRSGVPVVPVVAHGSHHVMIILSRGERLARVLGLRRMRIKAFPVVLGPLGVTSILIPPPPMPAAITVEFLPPLDWSADGPQAAVDDDVVSARYEEIAALMQAALDRLRAEHPHPVARGIATLLRHGPTHVEVPSP